MLAVVLVVGLVAGCSNDVTSQLAPGFDDDGREQPVILGELDWVNTSTLSTGPQQAAADAVGYLYVPRTRQRCTAFLISEDVVLTNHHCVSNAQDAAFVNVAFDYEHLALPQDWDIVRCEEWLGGDALLDYALLRCEGTPGIDHGFLSLAQRQAVVDEDVYLLHHNCDWVSAPHCDKSKKLSPGVVQFPLWRIEHTSDSLGGSSGGALMSATDHVVVGVHYAHRFGADPTNFARPGVDVRAHIEANHPGVLGSSSAADEPDAPPVEDDAPGVTEADEVEPNDDATVATAVSLPAVIDGTVDDASDEDWLRVDAVGVVSAHLHFEHDDGDLDLYAFDEGGAQLASSLSVSDDEEITVEHDGAVWLQVVGWSGATGDWTLAVE
jgi:hypothetical protein